MSPATAPRPIQDVAAALDLPAEALVPYGRHKAKLDHRLGAKDPKAGVRTVLVTAVNPTPAGEGKTVHTIGLSMALCRLGKRAIATLRQPSMGPIFGIKGGGSGGGASQVLPRDEVNLHLTGDFHAVAAANNLLAAAIDTSMVLDNPLQLDPERVTWRRVLDVNDRALREVRTGLGGTANGIPRDGAFDITAASEIMAILALARDLGDLRKRLGAIAVGTSFGGALVRAEDLGVAGAMCAVLRDAIDPTLVQTSEGTPVLMHAGPFANIAQGNCSIVADRIAAQYGEYIVTEAGFGADMGAEKYLNVKCRISGMRPDVAVVVTTVRALKFHSGRFAVKPGSPLPADLNEENLEALEEGSSNLAAHLATLRKAGIPCVVAINRFPTDTEAEIALAKRLAMAAGARAAATSEVFAKGGAGGMELAEAVVEAAESGEAQVRLTYPNEASIADKVRAVAELHYGAGSVVFEPRAVEQLGRIEAQGFGLLPLCIAKTQYSRSHDPKKLGAPTGYEFPIRELRVYAGAGFVVPLAGQILTMPGMGRTPAYRGIDVDANGNIVGI